MNYFNPYPLCVDETVSAAWKAQLAEAENTPWLARTLAGRASELFPQFATAYTHLRSLPRGARRSIQRRLARSREILDRAPEWLQRREGRRHRYKLARSLAGAALLLALVQSAQAATITVTTNKPAINDSDGKCSLIEAINNANNDAATHADCAAGSGADTIVLPAKEIVTLMTPYTNYQGDTGLPVVTSEIIIEGNGARIQRKTGAVDFRLFAVSSLGNLELQNAIVSGGKSDRGGGIYNAGQLIVADSTITANYGYFGGGVFSAVGAGIIIENSSILRNHAQYGSAIYNNESSATIRNSIISGNRATKRGGSCIAFKNGTLTVEDSIITKNHASGVAEMFRRPLLGLATVTITNSTISNNWVFGVLGSRDLSTFTIQNSTISGNRGGGMVAPGVVTVRNSTISGNRGQLSGGIASFGSLTLINSTVTNNRAKFYGGGIGNFSGRVTLQHSIIAGNKAPRDPEIAHRNPMVGNAFNLIGVNGNAGVTSNTVGPTDIVPGVGVTVGKILGPLKNNGGPTMTHALVPGSPAIDAIPGADPECAGTDQRGVARPQGAGCDIGAFEK